MSEKEEESALIYLGQKLSTRELELKDYACNKLSSVVSLINIMLRMIKNPEAKKGLNNIKQNIISKGTSLWISKADILTNLALRTGKVSKTVKLEVQK